MGLVRALASVAVLCAAVAPARAAVDEDAPAPATVARTAATLHLTPPGERRKRLFTWIVGGVGLGLLGGALGSGLASQLTFDAVAAGCPTARCDLASQSNAQGELSTSRTLSVVTNVLLPIGLVAEGVATALFALEGRTKKPPAHPDLVPIFLPSGAGLALSAKFL